MLAGQHRLNAIRQLHDTDAAAFERWFPGGLIPTRVLGFGADEDRQAAVKAMLSETFHRKQFTREEVLQTRDRLESMGVLQVGPRGNQKNGLNSTDWLARYFNVTPRKMRRILSKPEPSRKSRPVVAKAAQPLVASVSVERAPGPDPGEPVAQCATEPTEKGGSVDREPAQKAPAIPEKVWHRHAGLSRLERAQASIECLTDEELEQLTTWITEQHRPRRIAAQERKMSA